MAAPLVSIVVPLYNDEAHVGAALESCIAQTLPEFEVIAVDDASSDGTIRIAESYAEADPRFRVIRLPTNQSAFQARKAGLAAAQSQRIIFLDGDDELAPHAIETILALAAQHEADVVGFGCSVLRPGGSRVAEFERELQPQHQVLLGNDILAKLFPIGKPAQGQLWRYLFDRDLLSRAYAAVAHDVVLHRANDIPIAFLALAAANKYVSTPERLYKYHFRRGGSGHRITTLDEYAFIAGAIDSIESIADAVHGKSLSAGEPDSLLAIYESVHRSVIGRVLDYVSGITDDALRAKAIAILSDRVGRETLVLSAADFSRRSLPALASGAKLPLLGAGHIGHVLIRASNLATGGAQGVAIAQVRRLASAGLRVSIEVDSAPETHYEVPDGVRVVQLAGESLAESLIMFSEYCRDEHVDVVIDHYIFYNDRWAYYALIAANRGIPMIGWLHNFALRPLIDGNDRLTFLVSNLHLLARTIVLSEVDVSYWRLRGISNVVYLPNPPSPFLERLPLRERPIDAPTGQIEIVWWGRLHQSTKQVMELIRIAGQLRDMGIDYRLTIVGPDGPDLTAKQLRQLAKKEGVLENLSLTGAVHGDELELVLSRAHVFVSTSIVEGYPLVFTEAQSMGLPVVTYELPWLAVLQDNDGVISVPFGDRQSAAAAIAELATDTRYYQQTSLASLIAAKAAVDHDFTAMYLDLIRGIGLEEKAHSVNEAHVSILLRMHAEFHKHYIRRQSGALGAVRKQRDVARASLAASESEVDALKRRLDGALSAQNVAELHLESLREQIALQAVQEVELIDTRTKLERMQPSVRRTGLRALVQRLLPPTMAQASFYARNQHQVSVEMLEHVAANQAALGRRIAHLESLMSERRTGA